LGSKAKIGKMEREILHHDLSGVEETLGNMVERLKVLENEENATLKKKLAEIEIVMANPNPEDPNVQNEDVPEEDPYHLLDYDEEEDPEIDIEEEEHEEDPVEEPEPLAGHGDQFDAHPNPQPGNMNDESSDSEFEAEEADDELEVEEAVIEPEATIGTGSQRPFAVHDFLMGLHKARESSTPRDPQFIGGLAPWALRRDLEALRRQERIREAESETRRTKIALLGSKAKIGKMEREILHHDLSGVEETLGNMVERLKVLENEENATLKKKLAEIEMVRKGAVPKPLSDDEGSERPRKTSKKSDGDKGPSDPRGPLMIMPPKPLSEARMCEIIRDQFATSMNEFMANMNNRAGGSGGASGSGGVGGSGGTGRNADGTSVRGAGPTVPELTGCTYATFTKCDPLPFNGTEGAVGLFQWFQKLESVFQISECKEKDRVKFTMATLRGRALTWWNGRTKAMGIEAANNTPWIEVRKWMTKEFCPWNVIQRMEQELYNLRMKGMDINGDVTSSQPATINDAVRLAYQLAGQLIQDKADEATEGEKRKGEGDRGSRGNNRREHNHRQNQRRGNAGAMTNDAPNNNETFQKCKNKRHAGDCWKNGQGGNNHGGVYQLGAVNAQEDPKVVTDTFLLNNHYATALFDSGADRSFIIVHYRA
nr:hypothetical protein [Tanacetum cinerariifolium]